ncbi:hypothetical protein DTO021D3_2061 [Paecilomyces variotii]|nr:hypothetical protein DTO032I3_1831 [Paecilomyces variotii]KAJ9281007.1 hypothetical protein DTO021D3_2061 [Paecilomyces variotii]KAJ9345380.1 hypothetical protein DTO027B6_1911 [Paecilomyces variotii]KAJ9386132.1 hypothetical protein DTO032I4_3863 [Paecilomyces variotii]
MNYQLNNEESFSFDCGCNVVLSPEIWICRVWRNLQATSILPNPTEGMNFDIDHLEIVPYVRPCGSFAFDKLCHLDCRNE